MATYKAVMRPALGYASSIIGRNWLDTSDSERRNLFNILETFGLVQRIELPTYQNGNLLDYIITTVQ